MSRPRFRDVCPSNTDKVWGHGYDAAYEALVLPRLPPDRAVVLEIGVHEGGSLALWSHLFPHPDTQVHGIDIDARCLAHAAPPRVQVHVGCQSDLHFLTQVMDSCAPPHLIVDDGSHDPRDFEASLQHLFPMMRQDGVYVVEDVWYEFVPRLQALVRTTFDRQVLTWPSSSPNRHLAVIYREA